VFPYWMRQSAYFIFVVFSFVVGFVGYVRSEDCLEPYRLELRLFPSNESVLVMPLSKHEIFGIRYIHSVDIKPVFEIFETDPLKGLVLKETYFKMFGAGMGYISGRGKLGGNHNWIWISDINEKVNGFILRVGSRRVAHTLLYRGREINLSNWWSGKMVRFVLKRNEWCR